MLDTFEAEKRLPARLVPRHPAAEVVVDLHLQMAVELVLQLSVMPAATEQPTEAPQQHPQPRHDDSPGARNRARIAVVCCHSRAAFSTWFLPARVNL